MQINNGFTQKENEIEEEEHLQFEVLTSFQPGAGGGAGAAGAQVANASQQQMQLCAQGGVQVQQAYCTQMGDTLQSIATRLCGDARMADVIYEMNKSVLGCNSQWPLCAGIVLKLPATHAIPDGSLVLAS
jgi:hypothetical protein